MKLSFKERTLKSLIYTDKPWADMCLSSAFLTLDLILLFSSTAFTVYAIVKNAALLLLSVPFVCFFRIWGILLEKSSDPHAVVRYLRIHDVLRPKEAVSFLRYYRPEEESQ